jgi:ADP-ribose pyrophosphatase
MTIKPWKVLEKNYLRKNVRVDRCELFNGRVIEPLILEFGAWITVVGLTRQQEVLLIRQYRHGVERVIWELPGGIVEPGESPLQAAKRELLEETGYGGETFIGLGAISPNPANHTNQVHSFLALDVDRVTGQHLDDTEEIDVFPTSLDEVIRMAKCGELPNSLHVSALFFALAHLKRIS